MAQRITEGWLKKKQPPGKYAEEGRRGFMVLVYDSGKKSFKYRYKLKGKDKVVHVGDYPDTELADAHLEYERLRKLVRKQIDPKRPIVTDGVARTFGDVAEDWYRSHCLAQVRNSQGKWVGHPKRIALKAPEYKRTQLDNHLLPFWKDEPFKAISRAMANQRCDEIVADGHPVMANRVGATIAQIWEWALDEDEIEATPMQGLKKRGGREESRERTLSDDEIKKLWTKLDDSGLSPVTVAAVRFTLLTGARRSEIAGARWREIDGETWTIPASRTKTGKAHSVPLSDLALEVLKGVRTLSKSAVFPSPGGGPMAPASLTRAVKRKLKHFEIGEFTPHDLRRTLRSKLAELGVQPVVAKKVLGHALEGMDRVYDRYDYLDERRDALQRWADHLKATIAGKQPKIVPIKLARERAAG